MAADQIPVTEIGKVARDALRQAQPASVMGTTSRGLFLRLSSSPVIFLSTEPYRGPLTLNLAARADGWVRPQTGSMALCSPDKIEFPQAGLSVTLVEAEVWQAPPVSQASPAPATLQSRLAALVSQAARSRPTNGLIGLLAAALEATEGAEPQEESAFRLLIQLQAARRSNTALPLANALRAFLGLGQGLTPSGDDLVAGFLLALNRWGAHLSPEIDTATLNQEIIISSRSATSALAASLIECATLGQADERLLLALDGILDGSVPVEACLAALAGWGSSSGYDALVGMALYLMQ